MTLNNKLTESQSQPLGALTALVIGSVHELLEYLVLQSFGNPFGQRTLTVTVPVDEPALVVTVYAKVSVPTNPAGGV